MNSDSDSDNDIFLDKVDGVDGVDKVDGGNKKFYQLQHKSDDIFTFKFMGCFDHEPVVSLGNFNTESKSFYLESNFISDDMVNQENENENEETNKLFPLMSIYVYNNGSIFRVITGIELNIKNIEVDKEYKGTSYIEIVDKDKDYREVIKRGLIFPGSTKIVYFLIRELSNEKIVSYINGDTKYDDKRD